MIDQLDTSRALRNALDDGKILVQYQPIITLKLPAAATYLIAAHVEAPGNQLITERDMRRPGINASLVYELDRWLITRALKDLARLRQTTPLARLHLNVSGAALANEGFADWVSRQLKLNDTVGAGLVLNFKINDAVKFIKPIYKTVKELKKLNVEICVTQFPDKPQAFDLLKYLQSEYIVLSNRLLKADRGTIAAIIENARKLKTKIILKDVDDAESVDLQWATGADMLQGRYIQGLMNDMSFDFESV